MLALRRWLSYNRPSIFSITFDIDTISSSADNVSGVTICCYSWCQRKSRRNWNRKKEKYLCYDNTIRLSLTIHVMAMVIRINTMPQKPPVFGRKYWKSVTCIFKSKIMLQTAFLGDLNETNIYESEWNVYRFTVAILLWPKNTKLLRGNYIYFSNNIHWQKDIGDKWSASILSIYKL